MRVLIIAFAFVLSLFAARLVELQTLRGPDLAAAALNQRIITQDIPATRGEITDIQGRPLATTIEVRDITADQTLVEDPAQTAAVLGPIIGMDPAELQPLLTGESRFTYLKKATDPQVWRSIQTWREAAGNDPVILQGIFSERRTIRDYPNGELASNVIGFTNAEGHGAVGLESGLDSLLAGTPGSVTFEQAAGGTEIPTSDVQQVDPVPGSNVTLTIDPTCSGGPGGTGQADQGFRIGFRHRRRPRGRNGAHPGDGDSAGVRPARAGHRQSRRMVQQAGDVGHGTRLDDQADVDRGGSERGQTQAPFSDLGPAVTVPRRADVQGLP
jgi:hypothetical protein